MRITGKDGKPVVYFDATSKVGRAEMDQKPKLKMDCVACHNASGHPFVNPELRVDEAMQEGRISRDIPGIKARAVAIIAKASSLHGPMDEQVPKFKQIIAEARPKGEAKPEAQKAEDQFAATMLRHPQALGVRGEGHQLEVVPRPRRPHETPGCFRCHDGKHFNDKGEAIRLQCTLCHGIPEVSIDGTKKTVASTVSEGLEPPSSHEAPNWMREHREKLDDSCTMCHGPIKFGNDGGAFCSNPACHGRKWPSINLDADPPKKADLAVPLPVPGGNRWRTRRA